MPKVGHDFLAIRPMINRGFWPFERSESRYKVGQQLFVAQHFAHEVMIGGLLCDPLELKVEPLYKLTHFFKNLTKFIWVTPTIKNTKDDSLAIDYFVLNGVRKTLCQQPMKSEMN